METPLAKVLVVDDEPENLRALDRTLRQNFDLTLCSGPFEALEQFGKNSFETVISDQRMPGMMGTELLAKMASENPFPTRIILTAYTDTKELLDAINRAEIYRYITKPWDNRELNIVVEQAIERYRLFQKNRLLLEELQTANLSLRSKEQELTRLNRSLEEQVETRTAELKIANERLSELALTDSLTKILNRRALFLKLAEEMERSRRYRHSFALAMIDVDHFKEFNDMEGHPCGDEALRKIAQILSSNLRKIDVVARYGGEEFVLLMPETKLDVARDICQRVRSAVEASIFQGQGKPAYLTISIGVAAFPRHGDSAEAVIESADRALYEAKEYGRNRVVILS